MTIKRDGWVAFSDDHVAVATCEGKQVTTEVHAYPEGAGRMALGVSGCTAYIEASQWGVTILMCDHLSYDVEPASFEPDEAVAVLRAMLREISGPSIDDVREVWGAKVGDVYVRRPATRDGLYDVQVWDGDRTRTFMDSDLREALQAAYDAGVEMRGGSDPPA